MLLLSQTGHCLTLAQHRKSSFMLISPLALSPYIMILMMIMNGWQGCLQLRCLNHPLVLRPRENVKDWVNVVWFKGSVLKHAFAMWVANWDRLPTRERLASWGLPITTTCPFCSRDNETRDHMLLACEFGREVWKEVFIRCLPPTNILTNWSELLSWIKAARTSELKLIRKVATQAIVFFLWKQRNNLIHNQISIYAASIFAGLDREVRNIISAKRKRKQFSTLMFLWLR